MFNHPGFTLLRKRKLKPGPNDRLFVSGYNRDNGSEKDCFKVRSLKQVIAVLLLLTAVVATIVGCSSGTVAVTSQAAAPRPASSRTASSISGNSSAERESASGAEGVRSGGGPAPSNTRR